MVFTVKAEAGCVDILLPLWLHMENPSLSPHSLLCRFLPVKVKMPNHTATCAPVCGYSIRQTPLTPPSDKLHVMWTQFFFYHLSLQVRRLVSPVAPEPVSAVLCAVDAVWSCPLPRSSASRHFFSTNWYIITCIIYTLVEYIYVDLCVWYFLHSMFPHYQLWLGFGSLGRLTRDVFTYHVLARLHLETCKVMLFWLWQKWNDVCNDSWYDFQITKIRAVIRLIKNTQPCLCFL